ncbi:hypothetical protein ACFL35_20390 [Candidatus Riflebacteria bacterium]
MSKIKSLANLFFYLLFPVLFLVLAGCGGGSSSSVVFDPTDTKTVAIMSGNIVFPESAGTSAEIRAKFLADEWDLLINGAKVLINKDFSFDTEVDAADEYEVKVTLKDRAIAYLKAFFTSGGSGKTIDSETTAIAFSYEQYKEWNQKDSTTFAQYSKLDNALSGTDIDNLKKTIEDKLKSQANFDSSTFNLEKDTDVKTGALDVAKKVPASDTYGTTQSVTVETDQLTGFLKPGDTVQLYVTSEDGQGNSRICTAPTYHFSNPVGSTVILGIDPNTGVVTMGPDDGAARVWATCNGIRSDPKEDILFSGTGEGTAGQNGGGGGAGAAVASQTWEFINSLGDIATAKLTDGEGTAYSWHVTLPGVSSFEMIFKVRFNGYKVTLYDFDPYPGSNIGAVTFSGSGTGTTDDTFGTATQANGTIYVTYYTPMGNLPGKDNWTARRVN